MAPKDSSTYISVELTKRAIATILVTELSGYSIDSCQGDVMDILSELLALGR